METVLLSAGMLSRLIVIVIPKETNPAGYTCARRHNDGFVGPSAGMNMFDVQAKIEVERAKSNGRYFHLRFCLNNKYWARSLTGNNRLIVADSNEPEEDTSKQSCTLFEAVKVAGTEYFQLVHVNRGWPVVYSQFGVDTTRFQIVQSPNHVTHGTSNLSFVNWETLIKLPKRVALKGSNGKYLQGVTLDKRPFLQFSSEDRNAEASGFQITMRPDGHVRIFSNHFSMFCKRDEATDWIWADFGNFANVNAYFWPVKLDDGTIALRNAGNNKFCKLATADKKKADCLDAAASTMIDETNLAVEELVLERKIYNVKYRIDHSRIFNEQAFAVGTARAYNHSDSEASISVEVGYEESISQSFSHSYSLSLGVNQVFQGGIPFILSYQIEVSTEVTFALEWNKTTTETKSLKATGAVTVPPRSVATVSCLGTRGTYDVPFSYTQEDRSSTDGAIIRSEESDGVFRGVSSYNFTFIVEKAEPL